MIRQLSSLKMYCAKKIVVIFMRRNCYLAICRTELFRLDSTRLGLPRIAVGVELVTRALFAAWHAAASLIVDFRCLALPFLSTCNTCHVRQCATPTATVKTADNAMATASVTSLPSLPPSPPPPPPLLACRGACIIIIIIYSCQQSEAEEEQPLPEDAD